MRRMVGAIPRGLPDHRTLEGHVYREYVAAKLARYPGLAPDGRPWLKEAGRLVVALDRLTVEVETVRLTLSSGAGRRARDRRAACSASSNAGLLGCASRWPTPRGGSERKSPTLAEAIAEASARANGSQA